MRKYISAATIALSLLCGTAYSQTPTASAYPAIAAKDAPRAEQWIQSHKNKLAQLDAYVALTSYEKILDGQVGSINDLRRELMAPHPNVDFRAHPEFEGLRVRLINLRRELSRKGRYVGEWKEWKFDGQTVGEEETKYISSFEDKFNGLHNSNGVSPQGDEKIAKMRDILARPEMASNPVLKAYKENYAQHVLFGAIYRDALLRVKAVGNAFRSVKNDVDKNWKNCRGECVKRVHGEGKHVVDFIDQVKAAGLDPKSYKIKLDEREPLSEEWTLDKVRAEAVKLSVK